MDRGAVWHNAAWSTRRLLRDSQRFVRGHGREVGYAWARLRLTPRRSMLGVTRLVQAGST
jgi:hypothetical protein